MRVFLSLLFLVLCLGAVSQQSRLGTWNVINTRVTLSPNWSVFNELQLRSQLLYNHNYYYEIKGGVSYSLNKNFSFLLGAGKYKTYTGTGNFKKPVTADEFRFWEQITMNHTLNRLKFEHRYRIEQRWFKTGYRNRFRYRLNTALPLNNKTMGPKTFYIAVFNEVFFTNTAPYFERNRFFAGAGYQASKHITVQPGYVYQFDYKNNTGSGKHYLQLTLTIDINAHKNGHEKIPGNLD